MTIAWQQPLANLQTAVSGLDFSVTSPGSGYTAPPLVNIDPPPPGGIQTTATADMGTGAIAVTSGGAGYTSVPKVVLTGGGVPSTTVAPASGGATLPQSTLNVASTAGFGAPEGFLSVTTVAGPQRVRYTATTADQFLGCTGGTAAILAGAQVAAGNTAEAVATLVPFTVGQVNVTNSGKGFASPPTVQFSGGGGSGAQGVATLSGGQVTGIIVTDGGAGYTSTPTITLVGGGGYGALAQAVLESTGTVGSVSLTSIGSGYPIPPAISLSGAGSPSAEAQLVAVVNGQVTAITTNDVLYGDAGYSSNSTPIVTISAPDLPSGTQATATCLVPAPSFDGSIVGALPITITAPGGGYSVPPTVTISAPDISGGEAIQASATAAIAGPLKSINIVYGGAGYDAGSYSLTIGGAGGAAATATVATSAIKSIHITTAGQGYVTAPTVDISGDGTGAMATAQAAPVGVSSIAVTSAGKGYTSTPSVLLSSGTGSGASAEAVLAPTTVASVIVTEPGVLYSSPPAVAISGGGGAGATADATLLVVSVSPVVGGYGYGTTLAAPVVTLSSVDGNGAGATAAPDLFSVANAGDPFSVQQANALIFELASVGAQYAAGPTVVTVPRGVPVAYKPPPSVSFGEVDKATRFAAAASSSWFAWPASWGMPPSSDPNVVMTQRANLLALALATFITEGGTPDPFFAATWSPLYALAVPYYAYLRAQAGAPAAAASSVVQTPYDDDSSLGLRLQALVAQATEMADYLFTP